MADSENSRAEHDQLLEKLWSEHQKERASMEQTLYQIHEEEKAAIEQKLTEEHSNTKETLEAEIARVKKQHDETDKLYQQALDEALKDERSKLQMEAASREEHIRAEMKKTEQVTIQKLTDLLDVAKAEINDQFSEIKRAEAEIERLNTEIDKLHVEIAGTRESPRVAELIRECETYKQRLIELETELASYRQNGGAPPQYRNSGEEGRDAAGNDKSASGQVRVEKTGPTTASMVSSPL